MRQPPKLIMLLNWSVLRTSTAMNGIRNAIQTQSALGFPRNGVSNFRQNPRS